MNTTKISIIVPVYNTSKYLKNCLDSLINQSYKNLEIIVINDGSTDNSQDIIDEYAAKDSRIITKVQNNQGVSQTRNNGLHYATGEYVMFVDSDDWLDLNVCETALDFAEKNELDIVMWPYKREYSKATKPTFLFEANSIIWEDNNIGSLYRRFFGPIKEELRYPEKLDSVVTAWKLYRKNIISNVAFVDIKELGTGEDVLYNIQVFANASRVGYISSVFYHYRKDDLNSLTHQYKQQLIYQWKNLYKRMESEIEIHHLGNDFRTALSNRVCLGLIGLGLNLAEDVSMTFSEKTKQLKKILELEHYKEALNNLSLKYFPVHWKMFFLFAKHQMSFSLMSLLCVMNQIRGI